MLLVLLLIGRWLYAAVVPLELVADEAYYWDWSRQLDWGYYSKPPMVAWLIRLATELGGSTAWAVRTPAVVLGTLSLWWIYLLAARVFDARTGFWSVVLCAATPGNTALSLLMTIDAPFLFCWGMAMYALWRMLEGGSQRAGWIVTTGLATGLGLLSKESMVAFLMGTGLFVLLSLEDRRELRRPGLWLMTLIALACVLPVFVWNIEHDWITFKHSSSHFEAQTTDLARRLLRSAEFVASQFGLISPFTCALFAAAAVPAVRDFRRLSRKALFLICFSVAPLSCVLALSLTRRVMPNWPAPFYAAGLIYTVGWLSGRFDSGELTATPRWVFFSRDRLLRGSVWCGAICACLTCLAPWGVHWSGLIGSKLDPTVRLRGWNSLAAQVASNRAGAPRPDSTFVMVAAGRYEVSELAFYLPDQPLVAHWNPGGTISSQYDLWPGPVDKAGWDAVILSLPSDHIDPRIAERFQDVTKHPTGIDIPLGGSRVRRYTAWLGRGYRPPQGESSGGPDAAIARHPTASTPR